MAFKKSLFTSSRSSRSRSMQQNLREKLCRFRHSVAIVSVHVESKRLRSEIEAQRTLTMRRVGRLRVSQIAAHHSRGAKQRFVAVAVASSKTHIEFFRGDEMAVLGEKDALCVDVVAAADHIVHSEAASQRNDLSIEELSAVNLSIVAAQPNRMARTAQLGI